MVDRTALARVFAAVEAGRLPEPDGSLDVLPQPSDRVAAVVAFTARNLVVADVDAAWVRATLAPDDLSAPLSAPFLVALAARTERRIGTVDMVLIADPLPAPAPDAVVELGLAPVHGAAHARVQRAHRYRDDVRVWATDGGSGSGHLIIGRGLAGRTEMSFEVGPADRGRGVGRALALASRTLTAGPVWAQVAPGNAASVRACLAAGFRPVGAEVLLPKAAPG
jgi:hypothetical protein